MPKYNYEIVKKIINEKSNGECRLLSTEYVNDKTPLLLQCKCGNIFERNFAKLKISQCICMKCVGNNFSNKYRLSFEEVLKVIQNGNCEYISGEYKNHSSKLLLKCKCGNVFEKDISHFKRGQNRCQECGKQSTIKSKRKYNLEQAKEILSQRGYTLLEDKYIDGQTPMKCKCKRGHLIEIKLSYFITNHNGCKLCANIDLLGENHWNYKGGESEVIDTLRKSLKDWKIKVLIRDNHTCTISNKKRNLVVHHLIPFIKIVEECCKELNIPLHRKLKEYNNNEFEKLLDLFIAKHTLDIGITLNEEVHKNFHKIYGLTNNTIEQFEEFKKTFN